MSKAVSIVVSFGSRGKKKKKKSSRHWFYIFKSGNTGTEQLNKSSKSLLFYRIVTCLASHKFALW